MRTFRDIQDEVLSYGWGSADRDRVKTWINSAYADIASRTRWNWAQDSVLLTVSQESPTSTIPPRVALWGRLRPVDLDGQEPQFVDWHSFNASFVTEPSGVLALGQPEVYSISGSVVYWAPVPAEPYSYTMECWVVPDPMVNDLDEPLVPLVDREVLMAGACLRAATRDQNMAMMRYWGDQYEGMVAKMKQKQNLGPTESPRFVAMPASYGGMFG